MVIILAIQSILMDVDIRFVDIVRFVDTFSDSENATNEKTQEIQVFLRKKYKKFCVLSLFFIEQKNNREK